MLVIASSLGRGSPGGGMSPALSLWITFSHFARCATGSARFGFSSTSPPSCSAWLWQSVQYLLTTAPCSAAISCGDGVHETSDAAATAALASEDAALQ